MFDSNFLSGDESYGNQKQHIGPCQIKQQRCGENPLALAVLEGGSEINERMKQGKAFKLNRKTSLDAFEFSEVGVELLQLSHGTLAGQLKIKKGEKQQYLATNETG